jgi:putative oxidoreductase
MRTAFHQQNGILSLVRRLFSTMADRHLVLLRVVLGLIFFAHGAQKVFGWFGGPGYEPIMQWFTSQHIPAPLAWLAIAAELVGGLTLAVGLLARLSALGIVVNMTVATLTVGLPNGLFMNWFGQQKSEGIEFYLLAIVIGLTLVQQGAGPWSIDRAVARQWGLANQNWERKQYESLPTH